MQTYGQLLVEQLTCDFVILWDNMQAHVVGATFNWVQLVAYPGLHYPAVSHSKDMDAPDVSGYNGWSPIHPHIHC
jgi:hypothetical protein